MLQPGTAVEVLDGEDYHDLPIGAIATVVRDENTLVFVDVDGTTAYVKERHVKRISKRDPRHSGLD